MILVSGGNAFRTKDGHRLTDQGIRRVRRQEADAIHKVVVLAGEYFVIFDVEELMTLLGQPPKSCFRTDPDRTRNPSGITSSVLEEGLGSNFRATSFCLTDSRERHIIGIL